CCARSSFQSALCVASMKANTSLGMSARSRSKAVGATLCHPPAVKRWCSIASSNARSVCLLVMCGDSFPASARFELVRTAYKLLPRPPETARTSAPPENDQKAQRLKQRHRLRSRDAEVVADVGQEHSLAWLRTGLLVRDDCRAVDHRI